ncbi:MAG: M23 family metallopeptidase [Pseudomonadota bacterium]|nr:M23 family metallopeptidase [Pseudomonadota bacterium]
MRRAVISILCLAVLSGCLAHPRGTAAPYRRHVTPVALSMPASAAPIAQQFMALTPEGKPGHPGIDIADTTGTPVIAAAQGRVTISEYEPIYGNRVVIEHGKDRSGRRVQTLYYHLDARIVAAGQTVRRGQQIGTLGETGLLSSYPHLHFEYHRETAPGARTQGGSNWWQGMTQEDPNLNWADGTGRITCYRGQNAPGDRITYPLACGG